MASKKKETRTPWTAKEWKYCLDCFFKSENIDAAVDLFNRDHSRSLNTIKKKFEEEAIFISDVLGHENNYYLEDYIKGHLEKTKENLAQTVTRRELLRARKFNSLTQIMCEELKKQIVRLPAQKKIQKFKHGVSSKSEKEIVSLISDTHIGQLVKPQDIGGVGQFNIQIFKERLDIWKNELVNYIERSLTFNKVGKVHLQFLGDNVDGDDIYAGHGFHIEADNFKQVFVGSDCFANVISEISHYFPKIHIEVEQLGGNHGRTGGKKGFKPYRVNWDLLMGHFIKHKLEDHKNVTYHIPDVWFSLKKMFDWNFLFVHGDDVKGEHGVKNSQINYMLMLNRIIHYTAVGHQHSEKQYSAGYLKQFVNGDWVGGNSYSKQITKVSRPMQTILSVDRKYGVNDVHSIYFDTYQEYMERTEKYMGGEQGDEG